MPLSTKYKWLCLLLLLLNIRTQAQVKSFNNLINLNHEWGQVHNILEESNGDIVAFAESDNSLAGVKDSTYFSAIHFLRFNKEGVILIHKTYRVKGIHFDIGWNHTAIKSKDGNYLLFAIVYDTSQVRNNKKDQQCLIKFRPNGDTLWMKKNEAVEYAYNGSIKELENGDLIMAGGITNHWGAKGTDAMWMKTDSLGIIKWVKTSRDVRWDGFGGCIVLPSGNILIYANVDTNNITPFVIKVDKNGNKIWKKPIQTKIGIGSNGGFQCKDGSIIIYGLLFDSIFYSSIRYFNGTIIRLDTNANIIWQKEIGHTLGSQISDCYEDTDGNIIGAGDYDLDIDSNNYYINYGWVIKLDKNGNKIWQRFPHYNIHVGEQQLYVIIPSMFGGFITGGYSFPEFNQPNQDMWLLRLDEYGCDSTGCQNVGIAPNGFNTYSINIYPNPSHDKLFISGDFPFGTRLNCMIYDLAGRMVGQASSGSAFSGLMELNTSILSNGLYVVQVYDKDTLVGRAKFVVGH